MLTSRFIDAVTEWLKQMGFVINGTGYPTFATLDASCRSVVVVCDGSG